MTNKELIEKAQQNIDRYMERLLMYERYGKKRPMSRLAAYATAPDIKRSKNEIS